MQCNAVVGRGQPFENRTQPDLSDRDRVGYILLLYLTSDLSKACIGSGVDWPEIFRLPMRRNKGICICGCTDTSYIVVVPDGSGPLYIKRNGIAVMKDPRRSTVSIAVSTRHSVYNTLG